MNECVRTIYGDCIIAVMPPWIPLAVLAVVLTITFVSVAIITLSNGIKYAHDIKRQTNRSKNKDAQESVVR